MRLPQAVKRDLKKCPDCGRTDGYHPYECRFANKDLF